MARQGEVAGRRGCSLQGRLMCWDVEKRPGVGSREQRPGQGPMGNGSQGDRQETRECHIGVLSNSPSSVENVIVPIDKLGGKEGPPGAQSERVLGKRFELGTL